MKRFDGRLHNELRPVTITPDLQSYAEGSVIIEAGLTRILCSVTVEDGVPKFLKGTGRGWITAEYAMLPSSTLTRISRDSRTGGRASEIQRLIGRSLRATVDMQILGERTLNIDCDVIQADGGTRTASITGAYVALYQALLTMKERNAIQCLPIINGVAAVSVGIINDIPVLDMAYEEDVLAETDFNVVMTDQGEFVEIQGTAETKPFSPIILADVLTLANEGIEQLLKIQSLVIKSF